MKRNIFFIMLNVPGVCSVRVYTDILIGQAVTWKYFSFTDDIKWIKSCSTILRFLLFKLFICICTRRSRLKNDTNNNNETDGSKWLIVVVFSLDAHCSIALSLSSIIGCMHNLSTPLRLRINDWCEKNMDKEIKTDIIFYFSLFFSSTYTFNDNLYA
jgi:hypothetical protein